MIEIKIPKDIRAYKEKIFLDMNLRQIVSVVGAVTVCIPSFIFGKKILGAEAASWITIILGAVIALMGFYHKNGLTFEKYLKVMIDFYLFPVKRKVYMPDTHEKNIEIEYRELYTELYDGKKKKKKKKGK